MQETRVNKTQAVKLKAAGFDWEVERYHSETEEREYTQSLLESMSDAYAADIQDLKDELKLIPLPALSRVCDWMREVKGWHVYSEPIWYGQRYWVGNVVGVPVFSLFQTDNCPTHDLALSAGIDEVLEILEKEVENEK